MKTENATTFLQWALPRMGYRWPGFRKPRGQILKRIRGRMHELGLSGGYDEYKRYLESNPGEWMILDRLCDVTVSRFFRDRKLWDDLRDHILAEKLRRSQNEPLSIWSAGCCNGEEPYSIAIILEQVSESVGISKKSVIVATDRRPEVLWRARRGQYPSGALKELTETEIRKYFRYLPNETGRNRSFLSGEDQVTVRQGNKVKEEIKSGAGKDPDPHSEPWVVGEKLRQYITFEQRDIRRSLPGEMFDLVFCRNLVFTYFDEQYQKRFLEWLGEHLKTDGFLIPGNNENLPEISWLNKETRTHPVYKKTECNDN